MRKVWIAVLLLFMLILVYWGGYEYTKQMRQHYELDYKHILGIPEKRMSEEEIIEVMGNPNKIDYVKSPVEGDTFHDLHYDGFILRLFKNMHDDQYHQGMAIVTGKEYRFGRNKIGIGSSRKEIEHAYRWQTPIGECKAGEGYTDIGGLYYIYFVYDDDKLIQMRITGF